MEIKAQLLKPYTENERMDFIVEYNHNLGYVIEETETELQALGYTEKEIAEFLFPYHDKHCFATIEENYRLES